MQNILNTLTQADAKRLAKATAALAEDTLNISVTYRTDKEIRAGSHERRQRDLCGCPD